MAGSFAISDLSAYDCQRWRQRTDQQVEQELRKQLDQLSVDKQRRVVEFARCLASEAETVIKGRELLRFAGSISSDDLAVLVTAIEEGCEHTNPDEW